MDRQAILDLYGRAGRHEAGPDALNRLQHAWQCARLARNAGAAPSLQLAAWLHELGELLREGDVANPLDDADRRTPPCRLAAGRLQPLFGSAVAAPVALQDLACRCLASTKADFRRRLSAAARDDIERAGGLPSAGEARAFLQLPYAPQAVRLALWDLDAQDPALRPPSLEGVLDSLRRLMWLLESSAPLRGGTWIKAVAPGPRGLLTGRTA